MWEFITASAMLKTSTAHAWYGEEKFIDYIIINVTIQQTVLNRL